MKPDPASQASRRHRLHVPSELSSGAAIPLPDEVSHHAVRVLRLRDGDPVVVFDGRGGEYAALLSVPPRGQALVQLGEHQAVERELSFGVTLLQGISSADKMDFTIQKAVELGVGAIQPLLTARSVVRLDEERQAKRLLHWRRVVTAACEQCGRNRVPEVASPVGLDRYRPPGDALKLMLSPRSETGLPTPTAGFSLLLAVGPEAGFSAEEEQILLRMGFSGVRLGPRTLRTETAALAALAALNALAGDF
jgi:16S rRNA (uracil1498-N3)-methyltransferase